MGYNSNKPGVSNGEERRNLVNENSTVRDNSSDIIDNRSDMNDAAYGGAEGGAEDRSVAPAVHDEVITPSSISASETVSDNSEDRSVVPAVHDVVITPGSISVSETVFDYYDQGIANVSSNSVDNNDAINVETTQGSSNNDMLSVNNGSQDKSSTNCSSPNINNAHASQVIPSILPSKQIKDRGSLFQGHLAQCKSFEEV